MKKVLLGTAVMLLVLTGCSGPAETDTPEPDSNTSAAREAPAETEAPAAPTFTAAEQEYVGYMNREDDVVIGLTHMSDEELVAAGWRACELFDQGLTYEEIDVVTGDEEILANLGLAPNRNDREAAGIASQVLCTEHDITVY